MRPINEDEVAKKGYLGDKPKTMNTPVTTEFDLAVVASGYALTEREKHIAKWFYNRGKSGRSKHGFGQ